MTEPITIDIPHKLGRDAARQKIEQGVGQLAGIVPGGTLKEHRWYGDTLFFVIEAMGQRVGTKIDVLDTKLHAVVDLPPVAALLTGKIRNKLQRVGIKLLG